MGLAHNAGRSTGAAQAHPLLIKVRRTARVAPPRQTTRRRLFAGHHARLSDVHGWICAEARRAPHRRGTRPCDAAPPAGWSGRTLTELSRRLTGGKGGGSRCDAARNRTALTAHVSRTRRGSCTSSLRNGWARSGDKQRQLWEFDAGAAHVLMSTHKVYRRHADTGHSHRPPRSPLLPRRLELLRPPAQPASQLPTHTAKIAPNGGPREPPTSRGGASKRCLHLLADGEDGVAREALVDEHAGDAHHRGAAVVALGVELELLDLRVGVPASACAKESASA